MTPPEPATEKQISYAVKLKIPNAAQYNKAELRKMIDDKLGNPTPKSINQGQPVNAPVTNPTMPKDTLFVTPKDRIIVREVAIKAAVVIAAAAIESNTLLDTLKLATEFENWILR